MKQSTTTKTPRNGTRETASTLKALRALQPKRVLTLTEAKAIAARQANRLRARHEGNHGYAFDETIISEQPRTRIDLDDRMTMAGSTHWTGGHWQILINARRTTAPTLHPGARVQAHHRPRHARRPRHRRTDLRLLRRLPADAETESHRRLDRPRGSSDRQGDGEALRRLVSGDAVPAA